MSGAPSRNKGHEFERAVARYLGTTTTRNHAPGAHLDAGDIVLDGWLVECKNHSRLRVHKWWAEASAKTRKGQRLALVLKRRQAPIHDAFVYLAPDDLTLARDKVMTLGEFRALLTRGEVPT